MSRCSTAVVELSSHPFSVRAGEMVLLKAKASPVHWWTPRSFCFSTDGGKIVRGRGVRRVYVDTTGLGPGIYHVKAHLVMGVVPQEVRTGYDYFEVI